MAGWIPILQGAEGAAARDAIRAIGDDLARVERVPGPAVGPAALFWAYAAGLWNDEETDARYATAVDRLVDQIGEGAYSSHGLFGGLAGDGWVVSHIASDATEITDEIDRALLEIVAAPAWSGFYDLVSGLVGLGVYFVERALSNPDAPAPRDGLAHVIRHLDALHRDDAEGTMWWTVPDLLADDRRAVAPSGLVDCGVAHGIAGVLALFARAGDHERLRALGDNTVRWLNAHRLAPNPRNRFPAHVVPGRPDAPTRTAWCYGDLGIAIALAGWNLRIGTPIDDAIALARGVADRRLEHTGVDDACLCHGHVGNAHLLNRLFQVSRDPRLREAAIEGMSRGLALRSPGTGIGGYTATVHGHDESCSLLSGSIGIGLALIAAIHDAPPAWDRMLMCDLPDRGDDK